MRGTGASAPGRYGNRRFIPAHAGYSRSISSVTVLTPVHPRACGEQGVLGPRHIRKGGSSPRMRGTGVLLDRLAAHIRFIPAHAGNSATLLRLIPRSTVHPRACGEQNRTELVRADLTGSSPRMRGTVLESGNDHFKSRFIPAHAGNRSTRQTPYNAPSVHPRACGEQP